MKELDQNEIYSLEGLSDEQLRELAEKMKNSSYNKYNYNLNTECCILYSKRDWLLSYAHKPTAKAIDLFAEETNIINKKQTGKILPRMTEEKTTDKIVLSVMNDLNERSKVGIKKYGVTLEREDVDLLGWLSHLREELMDAILYIKRAEIEIKKRK